MVFVTPRTRAQKTVRIREIPVEATFRNTQLRRSAMRSSGHKSKFICNIPKLDDGRNEKFRSVLTNLGRSESMRWLPMPMPGLTKSKFFRSLHP